MTGSITATPDLPACPPTRRPPGGASNDAAAAGATFDALVGPDAAQPGADSPGEAQPHPDATPAPALPPGGYTASAMPEAAEDGPAAAPGSNQTEPPQEARDHHPHDAAIHGKAGRKRFTSHGTPTSAAGDAAPHVSVQTEQTAALHADAAATEPGARSVPTETRNPPEAPESDAADGIAAAVVEADPLQPVSVPDAFQPVAAPGVFQAIPAPHEPASPTGQPAADEAGRSEADTVGDAAEAPARPHEASPQPASTRGLFQPSRVAEDLQAVSRAAEHPVSPLDRPAPDAVPRRGVEEAARTAPDALGARPATPVQSAWRPADFAREPPDALAMRARLDQAIAATGAAVVAAAAPAARAEEASGSAAAPMPAPAPTENPLPSPAPGTPAALGAQVVRAVTMAWRDGVGEARVRLDPGTLGGLTVALRVERGVVTATMTTDLPAVRDLIHAHERELMAGLAVRGLDLGRLVVTADPEGQRREPDAAPRPLPRWPRRQSGRQTFDLAE
jgi:hypothetical protein